MYIVLAWTALSINCTWTLKPYLICYINIVLVFSFIIYKNSLSLQNAVANRHLNNPFYDE